VPTSPSSLLVVGLTGGIGSGKSAVANLFAELGAEIVDTDAIAHALTAADGAAISSIRQRFGASFIAADGSLDRGRMRNHVFVRPDARQLLESILHPMIRTEADRRIAASTAPYVVVVVPLLIESGGYLDRVNRILVVDCLPDTQVARVMKRSGLTKEEAERILAAQTTRTARLAAADDVIDNEGPIERLRPQVERLHRTYLVLEAKP
jgi:dephospho-CoA kinase